jgi:hypothetical protein
VVEIMADSGHLDDGQILAGGFVFSVMQAALLAESGLDTTRPKTSLESRPPADDKLFLNFCGGGCWQPPNAKKLPKWLQKPQRHSISLIGTADACAVTSYWCLAGHSFF